MSHTIHWTTHVKEKFYANYGSKRSKFFIRTLSHSYQEKIGSPTPTLSIQADVLYPNAAAAVAVNGALENLEDDGSIPSSLTRTAVGCKGNQLDEPFPLEARVPVTLPLVQYPSPTDNPWVAEEYDTCAEPVLNWEKYIKEFHKTSSQIVSVYRLGGRINPNKNVNHCSFRALRLAKARLRFNRDQQRAKFPKGKKTKTPASDSPDVIGPQDDASDETVSVIRSDKEFESLKKAIVNEIVESVVPEPPPKKPFYTKKISTRRTKRALRKALFERHNFDVENGEHDKNCEEIDVEAEEEKYQKLIKNMSYNDITNPPKLREDIITLPILRRYKKQPEYKFMGTWNPLFSGHGACDWIRDSTDRSRRHILMGVGTKLRVATIKPSDSTQMMSYTLDNVWEEDKDKIPTNIKEGRNLPNEQASDLILQIVTARKGRKTNSLGAVRRGRSIEIYRFDGGPSLVTTIGNICYGTSKYKGHELGQTRNTQSSPLLVSFDLNPWFPEELTMLDENNIVSFIDFARGKTIFQTRPVREKEKCTNNKVRNGVPQYPEFHLNDTSGITYANHPRTCYYWANSRIYFHDYRTDTLSNTNCLELLNLKSSAVVRSWSEQMMFEDDPKQLLESVTVVKPSKATNTNSMYYHVGTTDRIFLMDLRVPGNPVLKMNHGLRSPAAYLDVIHDDNYEVVVAGSQRLPEIFCAIHDTAHVSCAERVDCTARNPVLQSYPRHLSNSVEFFEFTENEGYSPAWESDNRKAKDHCYSWSTGLSVMKLPKRMSSRIPPGFALFHGNSFGDIFYQEWDQKPIQTDRKTNIADVKLTTYLDQWKQSMTSNNPNEYFLPSINPREPVNCALLIDVNGEIVKKAAVIREGLFNPFELNASTYQRVKNRLKPLSAQIADAKKFDTAFGHGLLNVWENVDNVNVPGINKLEGNYNPDSPELLDLLTDISGHRPTGSQRDEPNAAPGSLTATEQRIIAEIKQDYETDINVNNFADHPSDVSIIDDNGFFNQNETQTRVTRGGGFEMTEADHKNDFRHERQEQEEEENEFVYQQIYSSVTDQFQLGKVDDNAEDVLPDLSEQMVEGDQWEDMIRGNVLEEVEQVEVDIDEFELKERQDPVVDLINLG